MINTQNSHIKDKEITFTEHNHVYTINGLNVRPISVTTLIHKFFDPFNADKIIDRMMNGRNWKTSKYYGKTKEEIKMEWELSKTTAATMGTLMHKQIEDYIIAEYENSSVISITKNMEEQSVEFKYFLNFWNDFKVKNPSVKPFRTEWMIYDLDKKIAGSIDFTLINENGHLILCDWKRSKEIKTTNNFQKGLLCFKHLDDCNFTHYCLQLNIYRYILEKNYNHKVVNMFLAVFHPDNTNYITYNVPFMDNEIKLLMTKIL